MSNSITKNNFSVEVKEAGAWRAVKGKPVFPFSHGELLDERLDEAYLTILNDEREIYRPLTEVRVKLEEEVTRLETRRYRAKYTVHLQRASEKVFEYIGGGRIELGAYTDTSSCTAELKYSNYKLDWSVANDGENYFIEYRTMTAYGREETAYLDAAFLVNVAEEREITLERGDLGGDYQARIPIPLGSAVELVKDNDNIDDDDVLLITDNGWCDIYCYLPPTQTEPFQLRIRILSQSIREIYRELYTSKPVLRFYYPPKETKSKISIVHRSATVEEASFAVIESTTGGAKVDGEAHIQDGYLGYSATVSDSTEYFAEIIASPDPAYEYAEVPKIVTIVYLVSLEVYGLVETRSGSKYYVVARDDSSRNPLTGKWKHSLYLLERTKLLEGIVCPSLTFTNAGGAAINIPVIGEPEELIGYSYPDTIKDFLQQEELFYIFYGQKVLSGVSISYPDSLIMSPQQFVDMLLARYNDIYETYEGGVRTHYYGKFNQDIPPFVTVKLKSSEEEIIYNQSEHTDLSQVEYITYYVVLGKYYNDWHLPPIQTNVDDIAIRYSVINRKKQVPTLKKLSITDCVNRVLELAEPLFTDGIGSSVRMTPRYKFKGVVYDESGNVSGFISGSQAEKYDKIIAPEFSMTECTLREQLKIIGSYIHAEPRLDENDEVYFEEYGSTVTSGLGVSPYVYTGSSWDVNEFCTEVRTNAKNLTSSLSYASLSCSDPSRSLYRSLRSEMQYARITAENGIVKTEFPIYAIKKVMCGIINDDLTYWLNPVDISGFVFESTFYSANLSSYASDGSISKNLALFYTQGSANISGLFYRSPNANDNIFSNFSIASILAIANKDGKTLEEIKAEIEGTVENKSDPSAVTAAARLVFQVSYIPVYAVTATHGKNYLDPALPSFSRVYNQSEQLVESSYYGENIKGVAARLGNVEKERTFILKRREDIPRTGEMLDGYAISAVSSEMNPYYIKCTLGLTKDFNRISEYIGVSSIRRMYEISERNVSERNVLIHNTVLLGDKREDVSSTDRAIYRGADGVIKLPFTGLSESFSFASPISCAVAQGYPKANAGNSNTGANAHSLAILPVIPTALGNSMIFSFSYKDNYSAGERSSFVASGDATGYWQDDVPYTDLNGKIYWLKFGFANTSFIDLITNPLDVPLALDDSATGGNNITNEGFESACFLGGQRYPLLLRKDNREKIAITYEIEFKTNRSDLIIGSALASGNPLVKDISESGIGEARIVFFTETPSKFTTRLDVSTYDPLISLCCIRFDAETINGIPVMYMHEDESLKDQYIPTGVPGVENTEYKYQFGAPSDIKGFAIVTSPNEVTSDVVDDDGNETTQTVNYGGEVLLMRIADIKHGEPLFGRDELTNNPRKIYFNVLPS